MSKEKPDQPDNLRSLSKILSDHGIPLSAVHRDPNINTTELPTPGGILVIHWEKSVVAPPVKT